MEARGDYIGGRFLDPTGETFTSHDPAHDHAVVLEAAGAVDRVGEACEAAAEAQRAWAAKTLDERVAALHRFRSAISARADELSEAISREMGKIRSEARVEINALLGRFALVEGQVRSGLAGGPIPGFDSEIIRYRPHGVVGVLGPFNFPLHLCHAHVLPALTLGNTVVIKPSEVTPLAGQRYAEAADAAGLPPGVLNVVQGGGAVGAALTQDPRVHGLAFTGSWDTGRRIRAATVDRPEMLVALEMGGKNMCVVREDAELRQAIHEVVTSGYLTTGQRCTCSDRVLVHRSRADALVDGLRAALAELRFGDPEDPASFAGPMANRAAAERFVAAIEAARAGGADVVVEGGPREGGAYVAPSLHRIEGHELAGYTDVELFGPDLCVEVFDDDDEAIAALNGTPFGFAVSVFTQDLDAFGRYERDVRTGILNRNRSTNKASPRLPFGGVKKSGNFRPAGAWAGRNLAYVMSQIHNGAGVFDRHAMIEPTLPAPELDRLEAQHAAEERAEASRSLMDTPRPMKVALPEGGALPESDAWHERFYAGGRYVRGEKKPPVFDHLRSVGPYMVSIDEAPLSVLDAMSQTATSPAGFAPDAAVRAYVEGGFGDAPLRSADTTLGDDPHAEAYAETLRRRAPGLPTVCFVNSGAEANEKAYGLCIQNAPEKAKKLLAFEGSFHGRTLLALYASHNPTKRVPFEIAGYEVDFAPAPARTVFSEGDPAAPDGWNEVWAKADHAEATRRWGDEQTLVAEVEALAEVARTLEAGEHFAVVVEPMQSEGGDRYLTSRFHRALRLLTRHHGVSLVVDEVQCGHGLGGEFLWHPRFGYVDADGEPDGPDCVCFAKRAQVGVCLSRFDDPEPTNAFPASLARGRIHAEGVDPADAARVEGSVRARLAGFEARWGHLATNPRAEGYALAFDLSSSDELLAYLGQRFWRGAVVFGAGTRTVRYRLNSSFTERELDRLFDSIHRSLAWLDAHPRKKPPAWEDFEAPSREDRVVRPYLVRVAQPEEADALMPDVLALEAKVYEPARRDEEDTLRKAFGPGGVAVVAEAIEGDRRELVGIALAAPADRMAHVGGVKDDPLRGETLYSLSITVDPDWQGHGIGRAMKIAQVEAARGVLGGDSSPRYRHVSGRNRIPDASAMARLNDSLGAYTVEVLDHQYEGEGVARYYRMPLGPFVPRVKPALEGGLDVASGLARPLAAPPKSLVDLHEDGGLFGPTVTKITLLNYLTPAAVRATEWAAALTPELGHAFLCSSRDETVDKSIRMLRWHRTEATKVVAFEGAYFGHTASGARSLSDPATHSGARPYFDWPRVPHPADGVEASIAALRAELSEPDDVLGVYLSPVQERTGRVIPEAFWAELDALRAETGVPVVAVETPSAYYRSGLGAFATSGLPFDPDAMIWWTGGQLGFVCCTSALNVDKPFTLVSTWDGDELSLIQMHHQLRAARHVDVASASEALEAALDGVESRGLGLYRVISDPDGAYLERLTKAGIRARRFPNGAVPICPPIDVSPEDLDRLARALRN